MFVRRLAANKDCARLHICLSSSRFFRPQPCTRPKSLHRTKLPFSRVLSCGPRYSSGSLAEREHGTEATSLRRTGGGSIEIIIGPMFAGKTSTLLQRIQQYEDEDANILAVKSAKDKRYLPTHINTHDGKSRECCAVMELSRLKQDFPEPYQEADVIAIDEAQFFTDLHDFCTTAANEDHKRVIVAGLNGDFRREKFGQILDLIPQADRVTKLGAECSYCLAAGTPQAAHFTLRILADSRQEVVGGADKYAPVCRQHYNELSGLGVLVPPTSA